MKPGSVKIDKPPRQQIERLSELYPVAGRMIEAGLPHEFVVSAMEHARESQGIGRLMKLWGNEKSSKERNELIADIQELIEDWSQTEKETIEIDLDNLDAIEKNLRKVKDELRMLADQKGGIKRLSELSGIPVPSLSRFFGASSFPRRLTLLKIKKALNVAKLSIEI